MSSSPPAPPAAASCPDGQQASAGAFDRPCHGVMDFGPDTDLRRWGLRLAERGGPRARKVAKVAVARNPAVTLHRLWSTGAAY